MTTEAEAKNVTMKPGEYDAVVYDHRVALNAEFSIGDPSSKAQLAKFVGCKNLVNTTVEVSAWPCYRR